MSNIAPLLKIWYNVVVLNLTSYFPMLFVSVFFVFHTQHLTTLVKEENILHILNHKYILGLWKKVR